MLALLLRQVLFRRVHRVADQSVGPTRFVVFDMGPRMEPPVGAVFVLPPVVALELTHPAFESVFRLGQKLISVVRMNVIQPETWNVDHLAGGVAEYSLEVVAHIGDEIVSGSPEDDRGAGLYEIFEERKLIHGLPPTR